MGIVSKLIIKEQLIISNNMRTPALLLKEYQGTGEILFRSNIRLKGTFKLIFYAGGICRLIYRIKLEDQLPQIRRLADLTQQDIQNRNIPRDNFEASLTGTSDDGGNISINWMSLDDASIKVDKTDAQATVDPVSRQIVFNQFEAIIHSSIIEGTGTLEFVVGSEVEITYERLGQEDTVSVFAGITNFIFRGCEWDSKQPRRYFINGELSVKVGNFSLEFINVPEYNRFVETFTFDYFMKQLKSKQFDITCECISMVKFNEISAMRTVMRKVRYILSFVTCNWLATLYEDTFKDRKLIRTILFPHKTFQFVGGQYAINPTDNRDCQLKRLVETTYENYSKFEDRLGLKYIIENYVMSPREGNSEAQYLLLAIALEILASYAHEYAKNNITLVPNITKKEKEVQLMQSCKKMNVRISDQFFEQIITWGGFRDTRLKDKLRYVFDELHLVYTEKELSNFVKYRNIMVHAGVSRNSKKLIDEWHNLANLIDRLILTLLGWKGNSYIDKSKDYIQQTLE